MKSNSENIFEFITAFVDNELDKDKVVKLQKEIESDAELLNEYYIQLQMKKLLRERFSSRNAPKYLYESILNKIKIENNLAE